MTEEQIIEATGICRTGTCKGCPYHELYTASCINKLMEDVFDLINRQKAEIERLEKESADTNNAETKHGQWKIEEYKNHLNVVCSNCKKEYYVYKQGQYLINRSNYCPNCGAKMGKGQEC